MFLFGVNLTADMKLLFIPGVDSKLAYFTRTYVRGFVATRPFIPTFMFIIMFTFVVFSHQLTLPFPHSWNTDVNLDK